MQKEHHMKVAGIIAEYNPFHNGHQYQIEQIRKKTDADHVIVIMSGDFLERGVPAITDKYTRAQMALSCGADLVLELPSLWSTASAERFASAGVHLLASTGVVDMICYGAEQPDSALMQRIVHLLAEAGSTADTSIVIDFFPSHSKNDCTETATYNRKVIALQKQGFTYPAARARALSECLTGVGEATVLNFLSTPNNILALEYEKAIARWNTAHTRKIQGYGIQRIGGGYHDETVHAQYSSATAIRRLLLGEASAADSSWTEDSTLQTQVPAFVYEQLVKSASCDSLMDTDDLSAALYARLWTYRNVGYTQFADCSTELSNKIANQLDQFTSFTGFATLLKTREVTYTRVCRVLLHILLDIRQDDYSVYTPDNAYLRVLGFRRDATELLSAIKKEASLPLVTKMADASSILSEKANRLLARDIATADLYRSVLAIRTGQTPRNEFTQPIVII